MESGGCVQHPGTHLVWSGRHTPITLWGPLDFLSERALTVEAKMVLLDLERRGALRTLHAASRVPSRIRLTA